MKGALITMIFAFIILEMFLGGLCVYMCFYDDDRFAFKMLWDYIKEDYNIVGCILIFVLLIPAILMTIIVDSIMKVLALLCNLFELLFKKD